jgi:hypothetical protein
MPLKEDEGKGLLLGEREGGISSLGAGGWRQSVDRGLCDGARMIDQLLIAMAREINMYYSHLIIVQIIMHMKSTLDYLVGWTTTKVRRLSHKLFRGGVA